MADPDNGWRVEYVPVDDLPEADRNARDHDIGSLTLSFDSLGFGPDVPAIDERTGRLIAGHGRKEALSAAKASGQQRPDGIGEDDAGRWVTPVLRGWRSRDAFHAERMALSMNRQGERGGWHNDVLADILSDLAQTDEGMVGTGYDGDDLDELLATFDAPSDGDAAPFGPDGGGSHECPSCGYVWSD